MPAPRPHRTQDATELLNRLSAGDEAAKNDLVELLYGEIHAIARAHMAREGPNHTLQPTALVHEAFLHLVKPSQSHWESRKQFFGLVSKVMRSFLVDHARRRQAKKRGGDRIRIASDVDLPTPSGEERCLDLIDLDDALKGLSSIDADLARVVELRAFGGLSVQEVADVLQWPLRTTERRLKVATAWLREKLDG